MYKTRCLWGAVCLLAIFSLGITGCGGGGSSSSDTAMDDDGGMPPTADVCPAGQTGTPPDCETPASQDDIDAEAMRVAGALGENARVTTSQITEAMGKIMVDETPTGFKSDTDATYTPLGGNWVSNAYTQTNQAGNVVLEGVLYNNVEDPTAQRYAEFFASDGPGVQKGYVTSAAVDTNQNGAVTFTESGFSPAADSDKFMFRGAHVSANSNFDIPGANDPQTPGVDNEVLGSFFDLEGKFTCGSATTGCNVRANSKGVLVVTGDLTFTPDGFVMGAAAAGSTPATGTMVQGVVPDPDYLVFGYWLEKTTARDGEVTYDVELYSRGALSYDATDSEGTATYEGPATGLYMLKTIDSDGDPTSPFYSGQFTADAMLTASFGGETIGNAHQDTVTGTITNFMNSKGASIADWTLTLDRSTTNAPGDGTFSGTTYGYKDGDTKGPTGDFAGSFHGPARAEADEEVSNPHPASVVGTFNGHFKNGHVAGAFGATKQ